MSSSETAKTAQFSISQSDDDLGAQMPQGPDLGAAFATPAKKKRAVPKEEDEAANLARFERILKGAVLNAEKNIYAKLLKQAMRDAIRDKLNAKFGELLQPGEIDKFASDSANMATYDLQNMKGIPKKYQVTLSNDSLKGPDYLAEIMSDDF